MKREQKTYPPSVEAKLELIIEASKQLDFEDAPLYDYAIREVFGEVLLEQWFSGDEDDLCLSANDVFNLFKKAVAVGVVDGLMDKGVIDMIESDEGDIVFLTEKGKQQYAHELANLN